MNRNSRHIAYMGGSLAIIGIIYFLSLVGGLPLWLTVPVMAMILFFGYRAVMQGNAFAPEAPPSNWMLLLLAIGILLLTNRSYYIATKYGVWDAWAMWNMHAAYLADADHWKQVFSNTRYAHPDYPLMLPGIIAFFERLGGNNLLVPFAVHYLVMLLIPVWIYIETWPRSGLIAAITLLLFVTNDFYIAQGLSQLADTMVGFFLLAAMICVNHGKEDKRLLALSAFFIGCAMWTKNEGIVLAIIFLIFHAREFFSRHTLRYWAAGIALPLVTLLLFKLGYAPKNDIVSAQGGNSLELLQQKSRYSLIYDFFKKNLNEHFKTLKRGVILYIIVAGISRRFDRQFLMLLCCLAAYMLVYVISPNDLEWHLFTSQSRLMHQLMPAFMYVLALRFAGSPKQGGGGRFKFQARSFSIRQLPQ